MGSCSIGIAEFDWKKDMVFSQIVFRFQSSEAGIPATAESETGIEMNSTGLGIILEDLWLGTNVQSDDRSCRAECCQKIQ